MRQWRDCKTTQERQAAVFEAMQLAGGKVKRAAKVLGLSRQYLHLVLAEMRSAGGSVAGVVPRDTVKQGDTLSRNVRVASGTGVVPSDLKSLTSLRSRPTLQPMDAVADQTDVATELVTVSVQFPRALKERLERDALERKHRDGGRFAISPRVVELIEKGMTAEATEKKAAPRAAKRTGNGGSSE